MKGERESSGEVFCLLSKYMRPSLPPAIVAVCRLAQIQRRTCGCAPVLLSFVLTWTSIIKLLQKYAMFMLARILIAPYLEYFMCRLSHTHALSVSGCSRNKYHRKGDSCLKSLSRSPRFSSSHRSRSTRKRRVSGGREVPQGQIVDMSAGCDDVTEICFLCAHPESPTYFHLYQGIS